MKIKRIYTCEPIRFLCFSRLAIRFLGHKLLFTSFSDSISDKNTVGSVCSVQINRRSVVIKHVGIINHSGGWRALFHGESHQSYQKKMVFMWQIRRKPEAKSTKLFQCGEWLAGTPKSVLRSQRIVFRRPLSFSFHCVRSFFISLSTTFKVYLPTLISKRFFCYYFFF